MSLNGQDAYDQNYRPHLPSDKDAPILDIGCGYGDFLEYLEQSGYRQLRGVEIDPARVQASRSRTRAIVDESSDLETYLRSMPSTFAFIALKSVIAHFPRQQVLPYMRAMRDALQPGGTLVVETFNASRWTGPYILFNDLTHEWAYTEFTLRDLLERAGLHVVELGGEKRSARRVSTRLFHAAQAAWSLFLKLVFLIERGVGRNPKVLSKYLVAVCRREA